jgi:hypothetical protein
LKQSTPASSALAISARVLPDAGEDDSGRVAAGRQHPLELAAGHDVEAAALAGEPLQHREVRVRLDGIADQVVAAGERRW